MSIRKEPIISSLPWPAKDCRCTPFIAAHSRSAVFQSPLRRQGKRPRFHFHFRRSQKYRETVQNLIDEITMSTTSIDGLSSYLQSLLGSALQGLSWPPHLHLRSRRGASADFGRQARRLDYNAGRG